MNETDPFYLSKGNIHAIPIVHYNMEMAKQVCCVFQHLQPDCIAVELPENMEKEMLHAASRLPDISVVVARTEGREPIYYMSEPCDASLEALRSAMDKSIPAYCIDLDVDNYPEIRELIPDPYAIERIGLKQYYENYELGLMTYGQRKFPVDVDREMHMARRLKELSFSYERILFIGGMAHVRSILKAIDHLHFTKVTPVKRDSIELCTLTEESCRRVMAEYGWISKHYEDERTLSNDVAQDRQKLIFSLFKTAGLNYSERTGHPFPGYHLRNLMKFVRNYALIYNQLMPDLYKILAAAKGCVDHQYAYDIWKLATEYPYLKNIDALPELDLTVEEVWRFSKSIQFHLKQPSRKQLSFHTRREDKSKYKFQPPGIFTICSYPPEDSVVENFGDFLKKKGKQLLMEDAARTQPFSNSLEDGIDIRETVRHWHEKKLYVKVQGKPPGGVGSVVVIFDEDAPEEGKPYQEKFPWLTTWMGEHAQESDMALYATAITGNIVGPGISRCEYGGFMMSSPPRRMLNIWSDPDYAPCQTKAEVLLVAAIDYAVQPVVVYVAQKPPRSVIKSFAQRFGKKIVYIPLGQLSPVTLNKIQVFHVLDGHDKRETAGEYIF